VVQAFRIFSPDIFDSPLMARRAHNACSSHAMACKFLPPVENNQSALRASAFLHLAQLIYCVCVRDASKRARRWPFKETSLHRNSVNPNVRLARLLSNKLVASSWKRLLLQKCHAAFNCFICFLDYILCLLSQKIERPLKLMPSFYNPFLTIH
jgi:hypothetical protein